MSSLELQWSVLMLKTQPQMNAYEQKQGSSRQMHQCIVDTVIVGCLMPGTIIFLSYSFFIAFSFSAFISCS